MGRYEITLGKSPPPPPEPAFYFMGIDKGVIRDTIHIVVGHVEKNSVIGVSPANGPVLFIVDSAESVSPTLQELNKHSTTALLDFVKFSHKPMKARINCHNKFIDEILSLQGIPCEQCYECGTSEWRSTLYQRMQHFLSLNEKDIKYGLTTSEFQRAFELALSLAIDSMPFIVEHPLPFRRGSAERQEYEPF